MKDVQYPIAKDETGNLVDIASVDAEHRHDHKYYCPECGQEMRPRLGKKQAHCFYHLGNHSCNSESYIHKVGKQLLYERFYSDSSFYIQVKQKRYCESFASCDYRRQYHKLIKFPMIQGRAVCDVPMVITNKFDLKKWYDTADIEKDYVLSNGTIYRPDVLLSSSTNPERPPFFFEICYKHPCTDEKVKSGIRIMELRLDNVFDLSCILTTKVFHQSETVLFYNMKSIKFSREDALVLFKDKQRMIPCSDYNKLKFSPFKRTCFYSSGEIWTFKMLEIDRDHSKDALYEVSYNIRVVPKGFNPIILIAKIDERYRDCQQCKYYNYRLFTKEERQRHNTHYARYYSYKHDFCDRPDCLSKELEYHLNKNKKKLVEAKQCSAFSIKQFPGIDYDSLIDGTDYYLWIKSETNH